MNQLSAKEIAVYREAMAMVRLLYEDMVIHGVRTKSRDAAGRLLYSAGYEQVVLQNDKDFPRLLKNSDGKEAV